MNHGGGQVEAVTLLDGREIPGVVRGGPVGLAPNGGSTSFGFRLPRPDLVDVLPDSRETLHGKQPSALVTYNRRGQVVVPWGTGLTAR